MTREISKYDDVIDSRDVIARIKELDSEREELVSAVESAKETLGDARDGTSAAQHDSVELARLIRERDEAETALSDFDDSDEGIELRTLKELASEAEGYGDWEDGETLIRYSHWKEYVQQLCEDVGDIPSNLPYYIVVDWEATARNIEVDYMTVDFDGVDYLMRS